MRALAAVLLCLFAAPALAAPAPRASGRFTLEHLLTLRSYSDLTWSADGRRLAFVVSEPDTAENANNQDLWMFDLARGAPHRLTRHPRNDFSPTFSPSGDTLAFVGNRATGEDARSAIHMLSLHGGEPWAFGTYDESVSEVHWSPDGRHLAFVKLDTLPRQAREWRRKKWDHVVEDQRLQQPQLWVVEIATGRQRRLTSAPGHVWYVRWSPDSRLLAFLTSPTGKPDDANDTRIGIVAASGGAVRKLAGMGAAFAWSPDGRWIAWAARTDPKKWVEKTDLWVAPAAGGPPINLTAEFDRDAETPAWRAGSDTLYFHAAQGVSAVLAAVARTGGPVRTLADRGGSVGAPLVARNGRTAWTHSDPVTPAEVRIAEAPTLPGRNATSLNAAVAGLSLGTTRSVTWRSDDGTRIEGVLLRPPGAAPRAALKTLVLLHGGPYSSRYDLGFQAAPQFFAAHGYQVFMPNFRSSGGYGTAFMVRKRSDWGFQDWRDVSTGVDSLVRGGLADGRRLGVYGGSYGGYLSAWAITQTDRFDAAMVSAGAVDLASFYGQSDIQKYRAYEFEGPPWVAPENWRRSSPITHITRAKTPTLILIGQDDRRVPFPQGQQLYRALLDLGVPTEFVHYPREGHGLREPRHRADYHARTLAWFDRWIR